MTLLQLFGLVFMVLAIVLGGGLYLFLKWEREDESLRAAAEPERKRFVWHGDDGA